MIRSCWTLGRDYLYQLVWGRRALGLAVLCLLPAGLQIAFRMLEPGTLAPEEALRWRNFTWVNGANFLLQAIGLWTSFSLAPSIVSEEPSEGTLAYALARPVSKLRIFAARYLACAFSIGIALVCGQWILAAAAYAGTGGGAAGMLWTPLSHILAAQISAAFLYTAAGALLAMATTRPIVWAFAYFFFGEMILAGLPNLLARCTLLHHLRSLAARGFVDVPDLLQREMLLPMVSLRWASGRLSALAVLWGATLVFAGLAAFQFSRREWAPTRAEQ